MDPSLQLKLLHCLGVFRREVGPEKFIHQKRIVGWQYLTMTMHDVEFLFIAMVLTNEEIFGPLENEWTYCPNKN